MNATMSRPDVLIVDDDADYCSDLATVLSQRFSVETANSGTEGLERARTCRPSIVLLDIELGSAPSGFEVLENLRSGDDPPAIIMLTMDDDVRTVVRAIKQGAFHYVCKPPDVDELVNLINLGLADAALKRKVQALQDDVSRLCGEFIVGDEKTQRLLLDIARVAPTEATVLITGECGTGKEMVARRIHQLSPRSKGPFVGINCAAIPPDLIEAELFGHDKGAFTGADRNRAGKFELAEGGTIFLDEIGDSPELLQVKLLRVLEERSYYRVGGQAPQRVDLRVVAATSKDLEQELAGGDFRQELYYRLNVFRIHLSPLRERRDDILTLARHFLSTASVQFRKQIDGLSSEAREALVCYDWPGNVRELRNAIERAVIQCRGRTIGLGDIFAGTYPLTSDPGTYEGAKAKVMQDFKLRFLTSQLSRADGNVSVAAEQSGLKRQSFQRMLSECGVDPEEFRRKEG